jgi:hypothetical protein
MSSQKAKAALDDSVRSYPSVDEKATYTVDQFVRAHQISRGKFYQMVKDGLGPDFMEVGTRRFITPESASRWREKLTKRQR